MDVTLFNPVFGCREEQITDSYFKIHHFIDANVSPNQLSKY